jgi:hypothetical protein
MFTLQEARKKEGRHSLKTSASGGLLVYRGNGKHTDEYRRITYPAEREK